MGRVVFDISMSLDGYMTAAGQTPDEPLGPGGQRLTEWAFGADEQNRAYLARQLAGLGAVITGRATYDTSLPWWGDDGPSGPARRPVFVLTHTAPEDAPPGGVYSFVTDGIESALGQARAAAGDQVVCIMGGADIGQQFLVAGLVEELSVHLVPVLFGAGTRMFDHLGSEHVQLEALDAVATPAAIHTRFRIHPAQ
jgi:dihydrofolate reductase